jgi:hypothetical protein
VTEIGESLKAIELAWRWACSQGEAELNNSIDAVNGFWESLAMTLVR